MPALAIPGLPLVFTNQCPSRATRMLPAPLSTTVGASNVDLTYSPSTTNVARASLQVYVTGNSGVLAYVDDVRWTRS